jgi:hypothetical protein
MSKTELWSYLLIAGCGWWWLAARLDRLGRQLEWVSHRVQREMAELAGREDRVQELNEEWEAAQAAAKMETRQMWLGAALFGAGALAWWWFTVGQH